MARANGKNGKNSATKTHKRKIERYEHTDKKRVNNPPVGLVTPETDPPLFFSMAADDEGWAKSAMSLKAEIDPDLIEKYRGTISLPFEIGANKRIAVKVIDDRGIESLKVVDCA